MKRAAARVWPAHRDGAEGDRRRGARHEAQVDMARVERLGGRLEPGGQACLARPGRGLRGVADEHGVPGGAGTGLRHQVRIVPRRDGQDHAVARGG
jgi:hypothetical protein